MDIYSQLGNKTFTGNVVIKPIYQQEGIAYSKSIGGIFSLRIDNSQKHFGNPFSSISTEINKGLIATKSTKESVEKYIDWIINGFIEKNNYKEYTNHSGGAVGADIEWDIIGRKFGMFDNNHYWMNRKTPYGNKEILKIDEVEGQKKVTIAARQMGRIELTHQVRQELLIRNWSQVKYSDSIYAITTIQEIGDLMNYGKFALIQQGRGGTGYAIQMAINEGKSVYIFDQFKNKWFTWNKNKFEEINIPILTKNFAGIGTRDINENGKNAIRDIYEYSSNIVLESERRNWIVNLLKSEVLKGKKIIYYKELGESSHANALDYLINQYKF